MTRCLILNESFRGISNRQKIGAGRFKFETSAIFQLKDRFFLSFFVIDGFNRKFQFVTFLLKLLKTPVVFRKI